MITVIDNLDNVDENNIDDADSKITLTTISDDLMMMRQTIFLSTP